MYYYLYMKKRSALKPKPLSDTLSYTKARSSLARLMQQVCDDNAPVIITRRNAAPAVLISLQDYRAVEETSYLLKSPANAERLMSSIKEIESGKAKERKLAK